MSWITNLFKRKPKRLPARDAIGRFLADDNGNVLYTDSPAELIEKAKAKALKKDKELLNRINTLHNLKTTKTCACGGDCKCASKKPAVKKTAPKTAKAPVAKKPVAKKTTSTTAKKATPKKK
jgi:hypothetical protein